MNCFLCNISSSLVKKASWKSIFNSSASDTDFLLPSVIHHRKIIEVALWGMSKNCFLSCLNLICYFWSFHDMYISHRWCKLNFGTLQGPVKSRYILERIDARRHYFYFLHEFRRINGRKRLEQTFWLMIWIYYYLPNGIRLNMDRENSCWIGNMPNFATNKINIWFFLPTIKRGCITYCLTDNLSKFSYFSNIIPAWL